MVEDVAALLAAEILPAFGYLFLPYVFSAVIAFKPHQNHPFNETELIG
ncbi:MAG: hypothetical protein AABX01_07095 [Candidatus Micrarchaeota archaeon]